MPTAALNRLHHFLRPPGRGIYTHSTGAGYTKPLHRLMFGTDDPQKVEEIWSTAIKELASAKVAVIGIPSDIGAGLLRGANFGPLGVREAYWNKYKKLPDGVVDLGDVICVPHLLHDEMLSGAQILATRKELYPEHSDPLPVSPLSIAESALKSLHELNHELKVVMLGGDHSVSWPAMLWAQEKYQSKFGVLHFDAHTDMLAQRLGVKYCFATWAFHAQELMEPQHLVQVGIRTSKEKKEYWMEKFPIQQIWASEVPFQEAAVIERIVDHFQKLKCTHLYISNDIDGTDVSAAPATGTPEAEGLEPSFVHQLIEAMGKNFEVFGGDVVEVAPPLSGQKTFSTEKTCVLAADYLNTQLKCM